MNNAIQKINLWVENFVPYETFGSIEPTKSGGYKIIVSFYDTILNKMVDEILFFTKDGDFVKN